MTETAAPPAAPEAFVDIKAAAAFLGVSTKTIQRWLLRAEGFPVYRLGRQLRFRLSDVERWAKTNKQRTRAKGTRRKRA